MDPIRAAICSAFNVLVSVKLPNAYVNARLVNLLGEETICIDFTHRKEWVNNIIHNDPFHFRLLVQKDEKGWYCDGSIVPVRRMKEAGAARAWRKIRGKTEGEVMDKLTKWFLDNVDTFA